MATMLAPSTVLVLGFRNTTFTIKDQLKSGLRLHNTKFNGYFNEI